MVVTEKIKLMLYDIKNLCTDTLSVILRNSINDLKRYNAYFLKKEESYAKLKYSRVPSSDSGPGMAATLLSALLISFIAEKFGIETQDSTEFFYIWFVVIFFNLWFRGIFEAKKIRVVSFAGFLKLVVFFVIKISFRLYKKTPLQLNKLIKLWFIYRSR